MKNVTKFLCAVSESFTISQVYYGSDNDYECTIDVYECSASTEKLSELMALEKEGIIENLSISGYNDCLRISANAKCY